MEHRSGNSMLKWTVPVKGMNLRLLCCRAMLAHLSLLRVLPGSLLPCLRRCRVSMMMAMGMTVSGIIGICSGWGYNRTDA
jgi:hypothetical protein